MMTIIEAQNQIIQEMTGLDDWFDKYEYIIGLGKENPPFKEQYKTEKYAIPGCQSNVWIHAEPNGNAIRFSAYSDSKIIQGILVLLLHVLNNRLPEDIETADLFFINETGLNAHLSPSRANGLQLIIKQFQLYGKTFRENTAL
jgi:cysteine desulfuration protein SufE